MSSSPPRPLPPHQLRPLVPNPGCSGLASLAAEPTVSCATVKMSVTHPAPSPTGRVPGASTQGSGPTSHPSAQSVSSEAFAAPGSHRTAPHHFVPGHLALAHLARTRSCVLGPYRRSPVKGVIPNIRAAALLPCQSTGILEMPIITAGRPQGTPLSSPAPANAARAFVAGPRFRPHAGAIAASTRTANPACSRLASLRAARS
jgi:hypothetical protein